MSLDSTPASLRGFLLSGLPPEARAAVECLTRAANPAHIYAVGGAVRDLLLGRRLVDLDLAIEADAIDAVRTAFPEARTTAHSRFRTASLILGGVRIDVATARSETYPRPGALPKVAPAEIETDLRRRDFSVNAIALQLDGEAALIDPCGGIDDLRAGRIRVLHDASFRDDATRIFRAFRYAARLGFTIDPRTYALINDSVAHIACIGGERLRRELELLFEEEAVASAVESCDAAGALRAIHPALRWTPTASSAFTERRNNATLAERGSLSRRSWRGRRPKARRGEGVRFGFAVLAAGASQEKASAITARLKLKRGEAQAVAGIAALSNAAATLARPGAKPSGIAVLLDRYPEESVAAFAAMHGETIAGRLALRYLAEWRSVRPTLNGRDLLALRVPEGPRIHQGLQLLRAARLDGWAADRDDERVLIARFVKSIEDSRSMNASIDLHHNGD